MFPAGMLVTHQTNMGSANPVAVTAGECLIGVWCGCTVLPPLSFFFCESPTGGFERGGSFVNGVSQGDVVFGKLSVDHSRWLMWQAPRDFLSESL